MDFATVVYLCIFVTGFVFLLVSFVFGIEHIGFDHSFDAGSHDVGGSDHTIYPSFFSAKVIACFLVGVGTGAIVSHSWLTASIKIVGLNYFIDSLFGIICGLVIGYACWWIIKIFLSQQASSSFSNEKFVGIKIPLRVGIPLNGAGEISAELEGQIRSLDVRSESGAAIVNGTEVEVVKISGSVGIVRPC